ncbi:MAG: pre-peptidase C-terminal domain-containing protein [Deltaproteobacteria bacterium]|nr:pre-peptidase C-terminal domain-containing protein [Deltaproteobacteria bacterium]
MGCKGPAGAAGTAGVGETGEDGEKGDTGPPIDADPSISGVVPHEVFIDRTVDVLISGYGTEWTDDVTVDFGAEIEVVSIATASPTGLAVTVRVAEDAAEGPRTVTVTEGGESLEFGGGGFEVASPLEVYLLNTETVEQGSFTGVYVIQRDTTTPFYQNTESDAAVDSVKVYLERGGEQVGTEAYPSDLTPFSLSAAVYIDAYEAVGLADLVVVRLQDGHARESVAPGAIDVVARAAEPLAVPGVVAVLEGGESLLYSFSAAGAAEITVSMTPDNPISYPLVAVLPGSGAFEDALSSNLVIEGFTLEKEFLGGVRFVTPVAGDFFAVMGNAIYDPPTINVDAGLSVTPVTVEGMTPPDINMGAIAAPGEVDYFTFDAQEGHTIQAVTFDGATSTCASFVLDSKLELLNDQGIVLIAVNDDNGANFCSQLVVEAPTTGTYYLRLTGSPWCGGCTFDYSLFVDVVAP